MFSLNGITEVVMIRNWLYCMLLHIIRWRFVLENTFSGYVIWGTSCSDAWGSGLLIRGSGVRDYLFDAFDFIAKYFQSSWYTVTLKRDFLSGLETAFALSDYHFLTT